MGGRVSLVSNVDLEIEGVYGRDRERSVSLMPRWGECHSHTSYLPRNGKIWRRNLWKISGYWQMKRGHLGTLCEILTPPICGNLGVFFCNVWCQWEHHTRMLWGKEEILLEGLKLWVRHSKPANRFLVNKVLIYSALPKTFLFFCGPSTVGVEL
jgi:hypothetical protein